MKLESVQILRAVAALLVLFAHLWAPFAWIKAPDAFPNFIAGAAGVDLFFVISGFVMVYSSERLFAQPGGAARFLVNRLARIVPLYWAATTVALVVMFRFKPDELSVPLVIASYLFYPLEHNGSFNPVHDIGWTLNYEMFFYLVFAFAVFLSRWKAVVAVTVLFIALMTLRPYGVLPKSLSYLSYTQLWEFIFGMLIALAYRGGIKLTAWTSAFLMLVGGTVFGWTCTVPIDSEIATLRYLLWGGSAACILSALVLSNHVIETGKIGKAFVAIGNASYAIYLLHPFVIFVFHQFVGKRLPVLEAPYLYALSMGAMCIGVAIVVHRRFEVPVTEHLKRKFLLRKTPQQSRPLERQQSRP